MKLLYSKSILCLLCGLPLMVALNAGCSQNGNIKATSDASVNSQSQAITEQKKLSGLPAKIQSIAEKITVRIDAENENGSGVIVARQENNYYVVTAAHVVKKERPYTIVAPDGQSYPIEYSSVKKLAGADLAILQFQGDREYEVATLGVYENKLLKVFYQENPNPSEAEELTNNTQSILPWIFLFGWQRKQNIPQAKLTVGRLFDKNFLYRSDQKEVDSLHKDINSVEEEKGYQLSYSNFSQGGMSGGALLDTEGRVIGIHLAAEGERRGLREIKIGNSIGTSIQKFLELALKADIDSELFKKETSPPEAISEAEVALITNSLFELKVPDDNAKATDWVNYGSNLLRISDYDKAGEAFDKAISLEPDFVWAYMGKSVALQNQGQFNITASNFDQLAGDSPINKEALDVLNKITELDPSFDLAWFQKSGLLFHNDEYSEAMKSINKAIELYPENDQYHGHKATIHMSLQQYPEAISSISKAIEIEPKANDYALRINLYMLTGNMTNAQTDFNHLKEIDPDHLTVKILSQAFAK